MLFLVLLSLVSADVYMHNPRGANDRNCERNVNRNNGNLLYDTQNNAKGGYACPRAVAANNDANPPKGMTPRMTFEEGSSLEVEWTAQHGCGLQKEDGAAGTDANKKAVMAQNSNVHCEIVLQMGCASTLDPEGLYGGLPLGTNNMPSGIPAVPREGIPNSDGDSATNRISTTDPGQAVLAANVNNNVRYGVHETPEYYNECNRVKRNRDLFTADQNVNRRSAIGTRQNPNGGRRGLECPEERDYYPYWRPSPFLDVAYLVDDQARCGVGPASTAMNPPVNPALWTGCGGNNANGKCTATGAEVDTVVNAQGYSATGQAAAAVKPGSCVMTATSKVPKDNQGLGGNARNLYNRREWPSNKADCDAIADANIQWKELMFNPVFDMTAAKNQPLMLEAMKGAECNTIDYSRSNHLGNSGSADTATRYTMKIPAINPATAVVATVGANCDGCLVPEGEPCFLRIRYNMSSGDYARNLSSANNGNNSPIQQDPLVTLGNAGTDGENVVQLALNTNQVARTFQDRSYVFYVTPKPATRTNAQNVVNVNTRGKRGNIVQTYPAVEYDLIPNMVEADPNTVLQVQWTGSDYNPRRGCNDGEGGPYTGDNNVIERVIANANTQGSNQNSRTDRTNLVALNVGSKKNYPYSDVGASPKLMYGATELFKDQAQAMKFMSADAIAQLKKINRACLTAGQIENINNENRRENHPRNCAEANALSPYFATEEITFTNAQVGDVYVAYSSRNNNFSNRDTKFKTMVVNSVANPTSTPNTLPQEFTVNPSTASSSANAGLSYDAATGSYDSAASIDNTADADIPGFDPVENDDYGTGAKEGCTQEMIFYAGASSQYSFQLAAVCCFLMFVLF